MYPRVDNFYFSLLRRWRFILNQVNPDNYMNHVEELRKLHIGTREDLQRVAKLMYDKAVDEQGYSGVYAQMCAALVEIMLPDMEALDMLDFSTFGDYIIHHCQLEMEYRTDSGLGDAVVDSEVKVEVDTDTERQQVELSLEVKKLVTRGRALGNAKFVGELFNVDIISFDIIHRCVRYLLREPDELNIECVCKLLETIGMNYSKRRKMASKDYNQYVVQYLHRMAILLKYLEPEGPSTRMRYKFDDLLDLWRRKWALRECDLDTGYIDADEMEEEEKEIPIRKVKEPRLWLHV